MRRCFTLWKVTAYGNSEDYLGGEEVSAVQQTSSIGHSRASQVPTKLIQKGLDFGWEQSVTGPPS
jgi:hypothetical protein